jgi:CysZ protein
LFALVLAALLVSSSINLSDDLGHFISDFWRWDFGRSIVDKAAQVFGGLLIIAVGAVLFKQVIMVSMAPFMSLLSAKVEGQVTGARVDSSFSMGRAIADLLRGLRIAVRNVTRELLLTAFLFLLGLIPVFTPFTTVLIFLVQAYYAGFGNTDYTLERHYKYRESVRYVKRNRSVTLGNGIVFMALFLTVIGFLVALPLSTVAATLQT